MLFRTQSWRIAAALAIAVLALTPALSAQLLTGNIFGIAQDEQGGRLPGVTVTLIGAGAPRTFTTDAHGEYRFLNIAPGENYTLTYELQGFTKVTKTGVQVSVGRNTDTSAMMKLSGVEAMVTVRGEAALLETRKVETGATINQVQLKSIPTARDPWVILQTVPGIQVDRVNVGGSESGQQSIYVGKGAQTNQGVWNVDGVTITDMGALGSSPAYYDFDSFEEIQVGTGGTELSAATPGVQLNLVTKRGTNEYHGSARVFIEKQKWQSDNTNADLIAQGGRGASGNKISEVQDYGVEIGGPIWKDHVWVWGSYGRNQIDLITTGGATDKTTLEGVNGKGNIQFLEGTAGTLFYSRDDKLKFGRSVGPLRPPETGWNQDGPTLIWKGELSQVFSSKLFATASYSFVDGGFELVPQGGLGQETFKDANGVYHNSYLLYQTSRPQHQVAGNGSYFFNTGSVGHELKFGFQYRHTPDTSTTIWPGPTASYGDAQNGIAVLTRPATYSNDLEYYNGFIGDTITAGNLTVNAGVRYDNQKGNPGKSTVLANPIIPDILPGFDSPAGATAVHWKDWSPRVGLTYAIGPQKKLLMKASYARYADQLGIANISPFNAVPGYSYLSYYWTDTNKDNKVQRDEIDFASGIYGFYNLDPTHTTSFDVFNRVDPNLKAPKTNELIAGADYELMPDLVVGGAYTYRRYTDAINGPGIGVGLGDFTLGSVNTFKMLEYHPARVVGADGTARAPSFANCSRPEFAGICVPFVQSVYAFTNGAPSGKLYQNNDNYHQTYNGVELTLNKRLSNKWSARANFTYTDWKQTNDGLAGCMDASSGTAADPNNQRSNGGTGAAYGASCPGTDIVAPRSTGSGNKGNVFINSKWQFNVSGLYQLPLGFNIAGNFFGRQGYPYVQWVQVNPGDGGGSRLILDGKLDRLRNENVYDLDLRLDKNIHVNPLDIVVSLEVFNVTNQDTVLQRNGRENTATFNQIIEQQAPRVLRLGARISF